VDKEAGCCTFYADRLVEIAVEYRIDGWLINIECDMPQAREEGHTTSSCAPSYTSKLMAWLRYLTRAMRKAAQSGRLPSAESEVCWYDSITVDGKLQWQRQLNDRNAPLFACCDSVFLDYQWNPAKLDASLDKLREMQGPQLEEARQVVKAARACKILAAESPGSAVDREARKIILPCLEPENIYVGIDVWGRGQWGGGQWRCADAMKEIVQRNMSTALFAPAWYDCIVGCFPSCLLTVSLPFLLSGNAGPSRRTVGAGTLLCSLTTSGAFGLAGHLWRRTTMGKVFSSMAPEQEAQEAQ
jgi:mannosyl-glycoprotein endo-beta-N-acetylglucosaminidase